MNYRLTILTLTAVMALFIQIFLIYKVNDAINLINSQILLVNTTYMNTSKTPVKIPDTRKCESDNFESHRESL